MLNQMASTMRAIATQDSTFEKFVPRNRQSVLDAEREHASTLQLASGYLSPYFVTDPQRMQVVFEDAYVLICENRIRAKEDLLPLLAQCTQVCKPLLVIAQDVVDEALACLVVNSLGGKLQVAAVGVQGTGTPRRNMLVDIALLTGGMCLVEVVDIPLKEIRLSNLGRAEKIIVDKHNTIIEGKSNFQSLPIKVRTPAEVPSAFTLH